jgi:hypothetical protein
MSIATQICEEGTRMPDEQGYKTYLTTIDDALFRLSNPERWVMEYAWMLWINTLRIEAELEELRTAEIPPRDAGT